MTEEIKIPIFKYILLSIINIIMLAWGGIHLYRYFVSEPFIIRGIYGENWQNLILPIIFGLLILLEIWLYVKHGIKGLFK